MIGMQFGSFILLLIISVVISLILHYGLKFYVTPGAGSFLGKVVIGWIGGWLGSPVLGHWGGSVNTDQVFIIPAILGSLALITLAVDVVKSFHTVEARVTETPRQAEPPSVMRPHAAGAR
jgi:hypothetical protein